MQNMGEKVREERKASTRCLKAEKQMKERKRKKKKCTETMSEKGEYTLFISFCLKVVITCSITAGIASRPPMILRKCIS